MLRLLALSCLASLATAQAKQFRPCRNTYVPPQHDAADVTMGDVDGDGDLDVVVVRESGGNLLLLNDGRARFVDGTVGQLTTPTSPFPYNTSREADLVDIDGDSDLDLLVCTDNWDVNRVHVNNGAGVFTDVSATAVPASFVNSTGQVVADFDMDGDVDWFVSDEAAPTMYANNGLGVFTDVSATAFPGIAFGWGARCFAMDFEGDGDPDIVVPSYGSPVAPIRILLNQGNMVFVAAPVGYLPGPASYLAVPAASTATASAN